MKTQKIFLTIIFIILVATILVSADYSVVNPQLTQPGLNSANYNYGTNLQLSSLDSNRCERGQDFLIQIAPFGCTPAIVRSDLLEEQNVPVFCQLAATQINPLIDVNTINYVSFKGKMPEGISGVGFHPAQAAINNVRGQMLNSPILENIGYAVIVLDKQKSEASMPDSISGTLTANIKYDIQNTYGVGKASFYLPELNSNDWQLKFNQYGFWRNKGYLRAESIDENSATIGVYSDSENKISTTTLAKGQTSSQIDLPGFYCLAGMQLRLDSLENPTTRTRFNINGEIVEVAEGETFLENRCSIPSGGINKKGLTQEISIRCKSDEKTESFGLKIAPKITLEINSVTNDYGVGDYLFTTSGEDKKAVYLGYIGTKKDSEKLNDLYVWFFAKPVQTEKLSNSELSEISRFDDYYKLPDFGNQLVNIFSSGTKAIFGGLIWVKDRLGEGKEFNKLNYDGTSFWLNKKGAENFGTFGEKIKIIDFADPRDLQLTTEALQNYNFAMEDYRKIIDSFPNTKEKIENSSETKILEQETFGEQAFFNAIQLAKTTEQKKTMQSLCEEFKQKFPKSKTIIPECDDSYKNSNQEFATQDILVNNIVKRISFEGIYEPSLNDFSATIKVRNATGFSTEYTLQKNTPIYLTEDSNEFIELIDLEQNYATVKIHTISQKVVNTATNLIGSENTRLDKNQGIGKGNYIFTITDIKLKKVAKVSVLPKIDNAGTEANFSFNIGIEKRAIQLAPDEIEDRIAKLDDTIKEWNKISTELGNTVKSFNAACLSTGIILTAKNFFDNSGGMSIARNKVMRSDGGWTDICKSKVPSEYSSLEDCFLKNSDKIDADTEKYFNAIENIKITDENKDTETSLLASALQKQGTITNPQNLKESLDTTKLVTAFNYKGEENKLQLSQVRDLKAIETTLNNNPSDELKKLLNIEKYRILSEINVNVESQVIQKSLTEKLAGQAGLTNEGTVRVYGRENTIQGIYDGKKTTEKGFGNISGTKSVQVIIYNNKQYIIELSKTSSNEYQIVNVYDIQGKKLAETQADFELKGNVYDSNVAEIKTRFSGFKEFDKSAYQNKFKDAEIKYFETEPYKGMPAQVPFDLENGWYAAMKQTLATGGQIQTYDASGAVSSFYLCNVGENGKAEFNSGIRDDICQGYNPGTGQIVGEFSGLSPSKTNTLVRKAITAINDAQRQYRSGVNSIRINSQTIPVGNPEIGVPEMQCQDFMSPKDCNLLFNVCDPVVCPSSRCNLGGTYYSSNVIQSGIIGSIALCLPNMKENIFVPICLTGLKAGIDNLLSVFANYRDCLQIQLDSGETIGICDEIHSVYLCDFFWREALPFAQNIIPRIFESLLGQGGTRGGGEYLGVQSAWTNAQNSVDYMSQYYGRDISNAFKTKVTQEVGGAVCKNFISANYPAGGEVLDSLIEPESPPQYTAYFNEIPFTTATVPATSQYKVFYHIYAGQESKAFYRVYLKSPSGSSLYQTSPTLEIKSGFINKGGYATDSPDFTAPTGYQELCINVNGKDNCGFKQVSTSFAADYVKDKYLQEQAKQTDIKSQVDCVSGTPSLYSLAQPNLGESVSDVLNPSLYASGIIRICATDNPGKGTDINWNTEAAKWQSVGTCDGEKGDIKCWLDTESVKDVISITSIENETLGEVSNNYLSSLLSEGNYLDFVKTLDELNKLDNSGKTNFITETLIGKAFFNNQKAKLYLIRGNAYTDLTLKVYQAIKKTVTTSQIPNRDAYYLDESQKQENLDSIFKNCKEQYAGQCDVAKEIVKIAREIKKEKNVDDFLIKTNNIADCFEQLVLMQAMQESRIAHCNNELWKGKSFTNDFTCDGDSSYVLGGDSGTSIGIMQINLDKHPTSNAQDFESNVRYGINLLIENYNLEETIWSCKGEEKYYIGWEAALRRYNGLGCGGDDNYVTNVLNKKSSITNLFGDVCDTTTGTQGNIPSTEKNIFSDNPKDFMAFELQDNKIDINFLYNYTKEGWKTVKNTWQPAITNKDWKSVTESFSTNEENKKLIASLIGKNYKEGLILITNKIIEIEGADLVTDKVELSSEKIFTFTQEDGAQIYFRFDEITNKWKIQISSIDYSQGNLNSALTNKWVKYSEINQEENTAIKESLNVLFNLQSKDFYDGAIVLFDTNEKLKETIENTNEVSQTGNKWTIQTALNEINSKKLTGSYYEGNNKEFFDKLLSDGVITFDEHNSITLLYGENDIDELKTLLEKKLGKSSSETTQQTSSTNKWTIQTALDNIDVLLKRYGNVVYGYNYDIMNFIDELHNEKILSDEEYDEIDGGFLGIGEENLEYVKNLLKQKQLASGSSTETTIETKEIKIVQEDKSESKIEYVDSWLRYKTSTGVEKEVKIETPIIVTEDSTTDTSTINIPTIKAEEVSEFSIRYTNGAGVEKIKKFTQSVIVEEKPILIKEIKIIQEDKSESKIEYVDSWLRYKTSTGEVEEVKIETPIVVQEDSTTDTSTINIPTIKADGVSEFSIRYTDSAGVSRIKTFTQPVVVEEKPISIREIKIVQEDKSESKIEYVDSWLRYKTSTGEVEEVKIETQIIVTEDPTTDTSTINIPTIKADGVSEFSIRYTDSAGVNRIKTFTQPVVVEEKPVETKTEKTTQDTSTDTEKEIDLDPALRTEFQQKLVKLLKRKNTKYNSLGSEGVAEQWANSIIAAMQKANIPLQDAYLATVLTVIEGESSFNENPIYGVPFNDLALNKVENIDLEIRKFDEAKKILENLDLKDKINEEDLNSNVIKEILIERSPLFKDELIKKGDFSIHEPSWLNRRTISIKKSGAEWFYKNHKEEIINIKRERDVDNFINSLNFYEKSFVKDLRPSSLGAMQIKISLAQELANEKYGKKYSEEEMREILYTLDGGLQYGMLNLKKIINLYDPNLKKNDLIENLDFIFADYNAGIGRSQNAALQFELNELALTTEFSQTQLITDGIIGDATKQVIVNFLKSINQGNLWNGVVNKKIIDEINGGYESILKQESPNAIIPNTIYEGYGVSGQYSVGVYVGRALNRFDFYKLSIPIKVADINSNDKIWDWEGLIDLLQEGKISINDKGYKGMTLLHYAAKYKGVNDIENLIALGADISAEDNNEQVPLHYAVRYNNLGVVKNLVSHNPLLIGKRNIKGTSVMKLAEQNDEDEKEKIMSYLRPIYLDLVINKKILTPKYKYCTGKVYCSAYAYLSTWELFGFDYSGSDAWCRELNDKLVYKFEENDFTNNDEVPKLIDKGILKPGMIIGVFYAHTEAKEFHTLQNCGSEQVYVEYTHNMVYLGKNEQSEIVFAHLYGPFPSIIKLDDLGDTFATRVIVQSRGITL